MDPTNLAQNKILTAIMDTEEITWHSLINEVIKQEQMNPWDINITTLTQHYITTVKKLKEFDFRLSGKVVLAAAILLKIKSNRLIGEDIDELTRLIEAKEENIEDFYEELTEEMDKKYIEEKYGPLIPRTPQPRKRKVSITELIRALQKALEVKERRVLRELPEVKVEKPTKKIDITDLITKTYQRITQITKPRINFNEVTPTQTRKDKYLTFLPLIYLAHIGQRKINIHQEKSFGEIEIEPIQTKKEEN